MKIIGSEVKYKISDKDDDSDPSYYGFISKEGYWYILEINDSNNTFRYAFGSSSYTTNWSNRATLSYDYYSDA